MLQFLRDLLNFLSWSSDAQVLAETSRTLSSIHGLLDCEDLLCESPAFGYYYQQMQDQGGSYDTCMAYAIAEATCYYQERARILEDYLATLTQMRMAA